MDHNIHFLSQKTPENDSRLLVQTQKKITKKNWKFYIFPFFVLVFAVWYGGYFRLFGAGTPIAPNTTLDPSCAPTDPNCYVQVLPDQASSTAGKILGSDGSNTAWVDQNGGIFPYAGQPVSHTSLPGDGVTFGTSTSTLQDFIKAYFFQTHVYTYASDSAVGSHINGTPASPVVVMPNVSLSLSSPGGSTGPQFCTASGGNLTGCEPIDSSHINLTATWSTDSINSTTATPWTQHNKAVWSSGGSSHFSLCRNIDTLTDYTCSGTGGVDNGDGTSSAMNTTGSTTSSAVASNNITNELFNVNGTGGGENICNAITSSSFTSITSCTSPSLSILAAGHSTTSPVQITSSTSTVTLGLEAIGTVTTGASFASVTKNITFAKSRAYFFYSSTNYHTAGLSASALGTAFYNDAGACTNCTRTLGVSAHTLTTGQLTVPASPASYIYYAYPASLGTLDTSLITKTTDAGTSPDSSWMMDTFNVTNSHGGFTEPYYVYSYLWDGALEPSVGHFSFSFP